MTYLTRTYFYLCRIIESQIWKLFFVINCILFFSNNGYTQEFVPYASTNTSYNTEAIPTTDNQLAIVEYDFTVDDNEVVQQAFIRYSYESLTNKDAHRFTVGAAMDAYNNIYTLYPKSKFPKTIDEFLLNHGQYALEVMNETGIPASVILAQANIESRAGNTVAAKKKHVIFNVWVGKGKLAKWRKAIAKSLGIPIVIQYDEKQYREFYGGNTLRQHYTEIYGNYVSGKGMFNTKLYKPCFEFGYADYTQWCICFSWKGYATDPTYANQLINCIKKYHLDQYDKFYWNNMQVVDRFKSLYDVDTGTLLFPSPRSSKVTKKAHTGKVNNAMNDWWYRKTHPDFKFLNLKNKLK